ncbi:Eco57I restriction-modification methylase domain-containing protein [Acidithrix ferrooxidans]|uniref:site-specific DNA-methyltransferase (adenine-specific) n=1 Tax=Acidithrix ferrooxidans TaxID=1280514 RepID=A0A0D8HIR2_9ACTN|nr:N-6 DNA methylase [Acidithrix ferrooxidans]KJF16961.1 type IIS restriction enzyme Eco57I [Acidithrix ferrooxidans]
MSFDLGRPYNRQAFLELVDSLLPSVGHDMRTVTELASHFSEVLSLGSSPKLDLQIFEVKVSGSLDKRAAIASDGFKLMKLTASYRCLVAFYSDDTNQWRLSLMTAQPTIDNGKVVTTFSSPKRHSYLLGPGSKLKTPNKQLISKGQVTDFDDLSKRFAVEVVNNEFYKEVAKLYDELVGSDQTPGVLKYPDHGEASHEFAVRLIGRIIFCWFLREKRSDSGTPLVPVNILSRNAASENNYYHATLTSLFFEVLNKHLKNREDKFQRDYYASIPYLNGGLFSPDPDDYYKFDKALQLSVPGLVEVPDTWLRKLFDLLELYNFTVDENTSYDIDLSIDPEMLGRIFENLLARINPETGETVRRGTGSFYTPREIVEYMVDQSLKEYLKNVTKVSDNKIAALVSYDVLDDSEHAFAGTEKQEIIRALGEVRILDPACGSGAFPIGILQKIVFILQQVDPDSKEWLQKQIAGASPELRNHLEQEFRNKNFNYIRKLGVIRESIYGVDIQPIATEISRLRCFLTLIVDQSVEDGAINRGIEPLPNLDFKFVTANSLIKLGGGKKGITGQTGLFEDTDGINELKQLRKEYFSSHDSERGSLKLQFSQRQNLMLQGIISQRSHDLADLTRQVSTWDPFGHHATDWFDPEWMFGVTDGFDIVIGNPPYYKENDDRTRFDNLRDSECYQGKMDVWYLFGALGLDILKPAGILCYIATNNWTTNAGASKFRNKILQEATILQMLDFGSYFVFESSSIQTMVMMFKKTNEARYVFDYRKIYTDKPVGRDMLDLLAKAASANTAYLEPTIDFSERINSLLTFSDNESEKLLRRIISRGDIKLTENEVANGIHPHFDYVNKKAASKLGGSHKVGDGIFVLSQKEKATLNLTPEEESLIRPYYTTKQLGRYRALPTNEEWIIYTGSNYKNVRSMDPYPALKNHLDQFREVITSANHPYGLHRAREPRFFTGEKIMALRKSTPRPVFTFTDFDCYVSAAFYIIKTEGINLKYLTGLLNSKLVTFWLKNKGKMQGNNYQIDKEPLLAIPIIVTNPAIQKQIADKVDDIYAGKGSLENLEIEIDNLVYELYNLLPGEIAVIKNMK